MIMDIHTSYVLKNELTLHENAEMIVVAAFEITYLPTYFLLFAK